MKMHYGGADYYWTMTDYEDDNLNKYFIIRPGQSFEFNVNINATTDKENAGTTQSVYTDVRMTVVKYTG